MGSRNVRTALRQFEASDRHDLDAATDAFASDAVLVDHGAGVELEARESIKENIGRFSGSASDAHTAIRRMLDYGDVIVCEVTFTGTNDRPLGPLAPTGRRMSLDEVDIFYFDERGEITAAGRYYDEASLFAQLLDDPEGPAAA